MNKVNTKAQIIEQNLIKGDLTKGMPYYEREQYWSWRIILIISKLFIHSYIIPINVFLVFNMLLWQVVFFDFRFFWFLQKLLIHYFFFTDIIAIFTFLIIFDLCTYIIIIIIIYFIIIFSSITFFFLFFVIFFLIWIFNFLTLFLFSITFIRLWVRLNITNFLILMLKLFDLLCKLSLQITIFQSF